MLAILRPPILDLTCLVVAVFTATVLFVLYSRLLWINVKLIQEPAKDTKHHVWSHIRSPFFSVYFICNVSLSNVSPASFYGDGFVQLKATESSDYNMLRIRFRTSSTNGLLFLAAGQTDYLLLELHAGRLQVGTSVAPAHGHMLCSLSTHRHICTSIQYTQIFVHDHMHTNEKTCHTLTTLSYFSISVDSDSLSTQ